MNTEITTPIKVWQPKAGETLKGILVDRRKEVGLFGEKLQILIKDQYGVVSAVWVTKRLLKKLRSQCAGMGDLITLTFVGKKPSPGGHYYTQGGSYNDYILIVEKI